MRADRIARAAEGRGEGVTLDYAQVKWNHLQTGEKCARERFTFVPTIFEAHGEGGEPGPEGLRVSLPTTTASGAIGAQRGML